MSICVWLPFVQDSDAGLHQVSHSVESGAADGAPFLSALLRHRQILKAQGGQGGARADD